MVTPITRFVFKELLILYCYLLCASRFIDDAFL